MIASIERVLILFGICYHKGTAGKGAQCSVLGYVGINEIYIRENPPDPPNPRSIIEGFEVESTTAH